jgi:hypothetical protein
MTCVFACRLGARGLQAVAADPGAVRTNIYNNSPKLGRGFIKTMIDNCYAPPEDGAQVGGGGLLRYVACFVTHDSCQLLCAARGRSAGGGWWCLTCVCCVLTGGVNTYWLATHNSKYRQRSMLSCCGLSGSNPPKEALAAECHSFCIFLLLPPHHMRANTTVHMRTCRAGGDLRSHV